MGFQIVVGAAVAGLVVIVGCVWAAQPVPATNSPVPVPGFSSPTPGSFAPGPVHRDTLLPTDCDDLLTGTVDMAALLGQPVDAVTSHAIVGIASPPVGQLERLTCTYTLSGRDDPALILTVAGFTDPAAAAAQRDRNIDAESPETRTVTPVMIGTAAANVLTETGRTLLLVAAGRDTLTAELPTGIVPEQQTEPLLTDLAQRILPNLTPTADHTTQVRH